MGMRKATDMATIAPAAKLKIPAVPAVHLGLSTGGAMKGISAGLACGDRMRLNLGL
jgi:hypothetical protein